MTVGAADTRPARVQIRGPVMAWVLAAHAYALLVPLVLVAAVALNWQYVSSTSDFPALFYVAAAILCAGSAFEAAQNTVDRWYLTRETASADGRSTLDFHFYWCVSAGQALIAIAIAGRTPWVVVIAVAAVAVLPPLYFAGGPYTISLVMSSLLAMVLEYRAFGDPVVFLQLLLVPATLYFFAILLRTGAQAMHGFTTMAASSGSWFVLAAITAGAIGQSTGWWALVAIVLITLLSGAALWPVLTRLPATPRHGA